MARDNVRAALVVLSALALALALASSSVRAQSMEYDTLATQILETTSLSDGTWHTRHWTADTPDDLVQSGVRAISNDAACTFDCARGLDLLMSADVGQGSLRVEHFANVRGDLFVSYTMTVDDYFRVAGTATGTDDANDTTMVTVVKRAVTTDTLVGAPRTVIIGSTTAASVHATGTLAVDVNSTTSLNTLVSTDSIEINGGPQLTSLYSEQLQVGGSTSLGTVIVGGNTSASNVGGVDTFRPAELAVASPVTVPSDLGVGGVLSAVEYTVDDDVHVGKLTFNSSDASTIDLKLSVSLEADRLTADSLGTLLVVGTSAAFSDGVEANSLHSTATATFDDEVGVHGGLRQLAGQTTLGTVTIDGPLLVRDDATFNSSVTVDSELHVMGSASLDGTLLVESQTTLSNTLHVVGNASFASDVTIDCKLNQDADLDDSTALFESSLTVAELNVTLTSDLHGDVVVGDLTGTPANLTMAHPSSTFHVLGDATMGDGDAANDLLRLFTVTDSATVQTIIANGPGNTLVNSVSNDVAVSGSAMIGNDLTVGNNVTIGGELKINTNLVVLSPSEINLLPQIDVEHFSATEYTSVDTSIVDLKVTTSATIGDEADDDINFNDGLSTGVMTMTQNDGNTLLISSAVTTFLDDVVLTDPKGTLDGNPGKMNVTGRLTLTDIHGLYMTFASLDVTEVTVASLDVADTLNITDPAYLDLKGVVNAQLLTITVGAGDQLLVDGDLRVTNTAMLDTVQVGEFGNASATFGRLNVTTFAEINEDLTGTSTWTGGWTSATVSISADLTVSTSLTVTGPAEFDGATTITGQLSGTDVTFDSAVPDSGVLVSTNDFEVLDYTRIATSLTIEDGSVLFTDATANAAIDCDSPPCYSGAADIDWRVTDAESAAGVGAFAFIARDALRTTWGIDAATRSIDVTLRGAETMMTGDFTLQNNSDTLLTTSLNSDATLRISDPVSLPDPQPFFDVRFFTDTDSAADTFTLFARFPPTPTPTPASCVAGSNCYEIFTLTHSVGFLGTASATPGGGISGVSSERRSIQVFLAELAANEPSLSNVVFRNDQFHVDIQEGPSGADVPDEYLLLRRTTTTPESISQVRSHSDGGVFRIDLYTSGRLDSSSSSDPKRLIEATVFNGDHASSSIASSGRRGPPAVVVTHQAVNSSRIASYPNWDCSPSSADPRCTKEDFPMVLVCEGPSGSDVPYTQVRPLRSRNGDFFLWGDEHAPPSPITPASANGPRTNELLPTACSSSGVMFSLRSVEKIGAFENVANPAGDNGNSYTSQSTPFEEAHDDPAFSADGYGQTPEIASFAEPLYLTSVVFGILRERSTTPKTGAAFTYTVPILESSGTQPLSWHYFPAITFQNSAAGVTPLFRIVFPSTNGLGVVQPTRKYEGKVITVFGWEAERNDGALGEQIVTALDFGTRTAGEESPIRLLDGNETLFAQGPATPSDPPGGLVFFEDSTSLTARLSLGNEDTSCSNSSGSLSDDNVQRVRYGQHFKHNSVMIGQAEDPGAPGLYLAGQMTQNGVLCAGSGRIEGFTPEQHLFAATVVMTKLNDYSGDDVLGPDNDELYAYVITQLTIVPLQRNPGSEGCYGDRSGGSATEYVSALNATCGPAVCDCA